MATKAALSLKKRPVTLGKMNTRTENDGDKKASAADIPLKNVMLQAEEVDVLLGEGTWNRLFKKVTNSGMRDYPELADFVSNSSQPFKFDGEFENSKVTLHMGIDNEDKVELTKCTISGITYEPISGGLVKMRCQAQGRPDPDQVARIYKHMDCAIDAAVRLGRVKEDDESEDQERLPLKDSSKDDANE